MDYADQKLEIGAQSVYDHLRRQDADLLTDKTIYTKSFTGPLYSTYLVKTDVVVYVLKADNRDFTLDEMAFRKLFKDSDTLKRVIIAVNCSDKIEPCTRAKPFNPSDEQLSNINHKITEISSFFNIPENRIVAYSATEGWNINHLATKISSVLLDNLYAEKPVYVSGSSKSFEVEALDIVCRGVDKGLDATLGFAEKGTNAVIGGIEKVFNIFRWW